ncbi:MAG: hypothetical protein JWP73_159, partial [Phenylobacterium sp.]|nr:hypothetical protein [Phenylobacterium sp.]
MLRHLFLAAAVASLLGLAPAALAGPAKGAVPRAADGHADLSGVWTNASVTHLTRPPGVGKLVLSGPEAEAFARNDGLVAHLDADAAPSEAPDRAPAAAGDPGGYNSFWLDPGRTLG